MTQPEVDPTEPLPDLSRNDLFRLHAATYLSIVQALDQSGVVSLPDMSDLLASHADPSDAAPWAQVLRAFVTVMRREPTAPDVAAEARELPLFRVIDGGRTS